MADERLSADELAAATGTTPVRIAELSMADILRPQGGSFGRGDVQRVLVAEALVEAGLPLEHMARGIEAGIISFAETDAIYPDPGPPGPTLRELATELDLEIDALLRVITAMGMPRPDPETALHEPDREHLRAFVEAWRPIGDDDLLVRAARIYGDAIARAGQGWFDLFSDRVMAPLAARTVPWEQMRELAFEPGRALIDAGRGLLPWLYDRHLFSLLNQSNFDSIEQQLALAGLVPPAPPRPSAILFADLAGYTRLTEERGDRAAADVATRLAALADEIGRRHGGRLVKLLGDGVMLHFEHPPDAIRMAIELSSAMAPAGLPAAHIGLAVGAVVRRESDYFGRVVNLAARLAAAAGPREILVSDEAAAAIGASGESTPTLVRLEALDLKGIPEPVSPYRVVD